MHDLTAELYGLPIMAWTVKIGNKEDPFETGSLNLFHAPSLEENAFL
jgi:hypothetical protein